MIHLPVSPIFYIHFMGIILITFHDQHTVQPAIQYSIQQVVQQWKNIYINKYPNNSWDPTFKNIGVLLSQKEVWVGDV